MSGKKVDANSLKELLTLAQDSTKEADAGSNIVTRGGKKIKEALQAALAHSSRAKEVVAQKIKLKFRAFEDVDFKLKKDDPSVENVINWIVELFKDVITRINDQGEILAFLVGKVSELLDKKDTVVDENFEERIAEIKLAFQQKQAELEEKIKTVVDEKGEKSVADIELAFQQKQAELEEKMETKTLDLQKELSQKCEALEIEVDEARQRGLKGNLIVSSPALRTARGTVPSLAYPQERQYPGVGNESMVEMVLRLVHMKTAVRIPPGDVIACHPIGQRGGHTFILSLANRRPGSAWDIITHGMATGENFSHHNIFINYQLTKRRGELSKGIRKLKTDNAIERYYVDANGRFFCYKPGNNQKHEIKTLDDIKAITAAATNAS